VRGVIEATVALDPMRHDPVHHDPMRHRAVAA
jgi:hypothetical protein